jgi:cytochrome d ubiquinol oxidase subunit I
MDSLLAARLQMAISLGFHILFSVAGMAMPLLMVIAEWRFLRSGDRVYRDLAQRWAKGTAILFAVGAVSGTVLSFELGLLWPEFMARAGPLIGMPFSMEGFAFFLEAIALGIYLYGWDRVSARVHLGSGIVVAVSGLVSGVFVVAVNAWMNTPRGFRLTESGEITDVNLWNAFFTPAFPSQATHMALAAYTSVGFAVLGIHAFRMLKAPDSALHRAAVRVVLPMVIVATPLQVISGDSSAKHIAEHQPAKLAAAEALFETQRGAPLLVGGIPDPDTRTVSLAIHLPKGLSFLAKGDFDAKVQGLDRVPREDWAPITITHLSFQVMVGAGFSMLSVALWGAWLLVREKKLTEQKRFLWAATLAAPLGLIAVETGWMVTEVGRQPWIIHGVMRTRDAVTPMPNLVVTLVLTCLLYLLLGVVVAVMLRRYVQRSA